MTFAEWVVITWKSYNFTESLEKNFYQLNRML